MHYWDNAAGKLVDLLVKDVDADASGYYTFDLKDADPTSGSKVGIISVWSTGGAQTLKLHGLTFEKEDSTPISGNLAKTVDEGCTGTVLPALSSNMNSYYKSDNVSYVSDTTNGIHTITYPDGWNQIQFTLSKSVDLS